MACRLSLVNGTTFQGETGEEVTLTLKGPAGVAAEIIHIRYAGSEIDEEPPFQFTIKKGPKRLVILAEASKPGAALKLVELCGGSQHTLHEFFYDPQSPARGYTVRGV